MTNKTRNNRKSRANKTRKSLLKKASKILFPTGPEGSPLPKGPPFCSTQPLEKVEPNLPSGGGLRGFTPVKSGFSKREARKGPQESATSFAEGTIKDSWVVKKASNGVPRWVPNVSVELNGFRLLTVDYVAKNIGKPITMYVREYHELWPKKNAWTKPEDETYFTAKFVPDGDATNEKTKIPGWLKSRKPEIKKGAHFYINGPVSLCNRGKCDIVDGVQVDSVGKKIMSLNFMNQEVFVVNQR